MTNLTSRTPIIGVMGPGSTKDPRLLDHARALGKAIAENNWILLTGGRASGVMDAVSEGASKSGGLTLGILPGASRDGVSGHVQIPILTGMGNARNVINVLTADLVVICGMGAGTTSEAALAIKAGKPLLTTCLQKKEMEFLDSLSPRPIPCIGEISSLVAEIQGILGA